MTTSSVPEPPILAETEKARNCLGLNATVLPGLGTYRHGSRFRGILEMAVAVGGVIWFCRTLVVMAGEVTEEVRILSVVGHHAGTLFFSTTVVIGSWISGLRFGRSVAKKAGLV